MSRVHFWGRAVDSFGNIKPDTGITIYLAGTATPAIIYESQVGGVGVITIPQDITDNSGRFDFWVDNDDYSLTQLFDIVVDTLTYDKVDIFRLAIVGGEIYAVSAASLESDNRLLEYIDTQITTVTLESDSISAASVEQDQRLLERINLIDPEAESVSAASREQDQRVREYADSLESPSGNIINRATEYTDVQIISVSAASVEADRRLLQTFTISGAGAIYSQYEKFAIEMEMEFKAAESSYYKELTYLIGGDLDGSLVDVDIYTDITKTEQLFHKDLYYNLDNNLSRTLLTRLLDLSQVVKYFTYNIDDQLESIEVSAYNANEYSQVPGGGGGGAGTSDHGSLTGLLDDDHPQYVLDELFNEHLASASVHFLETDIDFVNLATSAHAHPEYDQQANLAPLSAASREQDNRVREYAETLESPSANIINRATEYTDTELTYTINNLTLPTSASQEDVQDVDGQLASHLTSAGIHGQFPSESLPEESTLLNWKTMDTLPGDFKSGSVVLFKDRLWILGGFRNNFSNPVVGGSVYSSPNGIDWVQTGVIDSGLTQGTYLGNGVAFDNKMWYFCGVDLNKSGTFLNKKVYNTEDGITWTEISSGSAPERWYASVTTFNNKIWIVGGSNPLGVSYDTVYSTQDGSTFTLEGSLPAYRPANPGLNAAGLVEFNEKLWLIGGRNVNNDPLPHVYNTTNGSVWTSAARMPGNKFENSCFDYGGKLWSIGGYSGTGSTPTDDIYVSDIQGLNWIEYGRFPTDLTEQMAVPFQGRIYVIGGTRTSTDGTSQVDYTIPTIAGGLEIVSAGGAVPVVIDHTGMVISGGGDFSIDNREGELLLIANGVNQLDDLRGRLFSHNTSASVHFLETDIDFNNLATSAHAHPEYDAQANLGPLSAASVEQDNRVREYAETLESPSANIINRANEYTDTEITYTINNLTLPTSASLEDVQDVDGQLASHLASASVHFLESDIVFSNIIASAHGHPTSYSEQDHTHSASEVADDRIIDGDNIVRVRDTDNVVMVSAGGQTVAHYSTDGVKFKSAGSQTLAVTAGGIVIGAADRQSVIDMQLGRDLHIKNNVDRTLAGIYIEYNDGARALYGRRDSYTELYFNGSATMQTNSTGINIKGTGTTEMRQGSTFSFNNITHGYGYKFSAENASGIPIDLMKLSPEADEGIKIYHPKPVIGFHGPDEILVFQTVSAGIQLQDNSGSRLILEGDHLQDIWKIDANNSDLQLRGKTVTISGGTINITGDVPELNDLRYDINTFSSPNSASQEDVQDVDGQLASHLASASVHFLETDIDIGNIGISAHAHPPYGKPQGLYYGELQTVSTTGGGIIIESQGDVLQKTYLHTDNDGRFIIHPNSNNLVSSFAISAHSGLQFETIANGVTIYNSLTNNSMNLTMSSLLAIWKNNSGSAFEFKDSSNTTIVRFDDGDHRFYGDSVTNWIHFNKPTQDFIFKNVSPDGVFTIKASDGPKLVLDDSTDTATLSASQITLAGQNNILTGSDSGRTSLYINAGPYAGTKAIETWTDGANNSGVMVSGGDKHLRMYADNLASDYWKFITDSTRMYFYANESTLVANFTHNGSCGLTYNSDFTFSTYPDGARVFDSSSPQQGIVLIESGTTGILKNLNHGSDMYIQAENAEGNVVSFLHGDPDAATEFFYRGVKQIETTQVGLQLRQGVDIGEISDDLTLDQSPSSAITERVFRTHVLSLSAGLAGEKLIHVKKGEPTGFENQTDSVLSFTDATSAFNISGAGGGTYDYFIAGVHHLVDGSTEKSAVILGNGLNYFYLDAAENLNVTQSFSSDLLLKNNAYVANIYWDNINDTHIVLGEERHSIMWDWNLHSYHHLTEGTKYEDGLGLGDITAGGSGDENISAIVSSTQGHIRDEDIRHTIAAVVVSGGIPVFYREGSGGPWSRQDPSPFPVINFVGGSGRLAWNELTGGAWQQTEVGSGNIVLAHLFASNDTATPSNQLIGIQGQNEYTNIGDAEVGATTEILNLSQGDLPFVEFQPIGTLIYQTNNTYDNAVKGRIILTGEGDDYVDFRGFRGFSAGGTSVSEHGNLAGLGDDDHLQYLNLDGSRAMTGTLLLADAGQVGNPTGPTRFKNAGVQSLQTTAGGIVIGDADFQSTITHNQFTANTMTIYGGAGGSHQNSGYVEIRAQDSANDPEIVARFNAQTDPTVELYGAGGSKRFQIINSPVGFRIMDGATEVSSFWYTGNELLIAPNVNNNQAIVLKTVDGAVSREFFRGSGLNGVKLRNAGTATFATTAGGIVIGAADKQAEFSFDTDAYLDFYNRQTDARFNFYGGPSETILLTLDSDAGVATYFGGNLNTQGLADGFRIMDPGTTNDIRIRYNKGAWNLYAVNDDGSPIRISGVSISPVVEVDLAVFDPEGQILLGVGPEGDNSRWTNKIKISETDNTVSISGGKIDFYEDGNKVFSTDEQGGITIYDPTNDTLQGRMIMAGGDMFIDHEEIDGHLYLRTRNTAGSTVNGLLLNGNTTGANGSVLLYAWDETNAAIQTFSTFRDGSTSNGIMLQGITSQDDWYFQWVDNGHSTGEYDADMWIRSSDRPYILRMDEDLGQQRTMRTVNPSGGWKWHHKSTRHHYQPDRSATKGRALADHTVLTSEYTGLKVWDKYENYAWMAFNPDAGRTTELTIGSDVTTRVNISASDGLYVNNVLLVSDTPSANIINRANEYTDQEITYEINNLTLPTSASQDDLTYAINNITLPASASILVGQENLASGITSAAITISPEQADFSYTLTTNLINTIDNPPSIYSYIIIKKGLDEFKVLFSGSLDSDNYKLDWAVLR